MNWFGFELSAFLIVFVVLNIVNVVVQTIKSIVTVNGSPMSAAIVNAVTFAIYTIVVVYMTAEGLGVFWKALIIGIVNFIGVYVVKLIEVKARKDKLWKVEATVTPDRVADICKALEQGGISYNCFRTSGEHRIFNIFCPTQKESYLVKNLLDFHKAKYFVSETKML